MMKDRSDLQITHGYYTCSKLQCCCNYALVNKLLFDVIIILGCALKFGSRNLTIVHCTVRTICTVRNGIKVLMSTRAALSSARELFLLSSEALEVQSKCQLLEEASRLYIEAADLVDDGNAKRAITYLSNNCLFQAHILKHTGPVVDIKMDDANEGLVSLYSNRLLLLSHKNREMRLKDVRA